ncbi:MAG: bifunctional metallophosphatase/5'-nucleotidase [Candidatus Cryptobacteroides sp.]
MKNNSLKLCLTLLAATLLSSCAKEGTHSLYVLCTNDVHGSWFDRSYVDDSAKPSLMAVNSYVDSLRDLYGRDNVLLIDSGDCLQGDNAAYYSNYVDTLEEHLFPRIASYMGYDAVIVGNHDIETGPRVYDKVSRELASKGIPFLAGNALKFDGASYFPEYKVFKKAGLKVLVLGYTNANIQAWLDKSLWPEMEFESLLPFVQERVDKIVAKTHPDVVVVSVHSGTGNGDAQMLESQGLDLFKSLNGVDVLLCSHDHNSRVELREDMVLLNAGSRAAHLGMARVDCTFKKGKLQSKKIGAQMLDIDKSRTDRSMREYFEDDFQKVKAFTLRKVGSLAEELRTSDAFFGQSFYMDLIHSVQLEASGADISFCAPLTYNKTIAAGELIYNDMFTLYPYENSLCVMELTGAEILSYLEYSYANWLAEPGSPNLLLIDKRQSERYSTGRWSFRYPSFNFDSAAGLNYTVDVSKKAGERIKVREVIGIEGNRSFDEQESYKVAMTSYRAAGGGDLLLKGAGLSREELDTRLVARLPEIRDLVYRYVSEHEGLSREQLREEGRIGRWYFVPENQADKALERDRKLLFGN